MGILYVEKIENIVKIYRKCIAREGVGSLFFEVYFCIFGVNAIILSLVLQIRRKKSD